MESFDELVGKVTGNEPYPYQRRIAEEGLPELLEVPTGAGKTLAATLPWLYRRRFHPDRKVRAATPRWLVYALPMRGLVEQTEEAIKGWLTALGITDLPVYRVMGGEGRLESRWRFEPECEAIFVGTLDMLLSRALNRGYGESRWAWPIDFGLFNNGTQWVFDEVQLMGAALPTSRQLQGLRDNLGTAMATASMWMSATVDRETLSTVDRREVEPVVRLTDADRSGSLARRLEAGKTIHQLGVDASAPRAFAEAILAQHRAETRTIVVLNTVERAREVFRALADIAGPEVVLLHSRFRPPEREQQTRRALADVDGDGLIVVSTQVIEAGVDVSATTLVTEAAPWPSIVQRAGRCNRVGTDADAQLMWAPPPKAAPYEEADIAASVEALQRLEEEVVTPASLLEVEVETVPELHATLRRRDLLELFDTLPDLSGNDVDVSRFIRVTDDVDVQVAWREIGSEGLNHQGTSLPGRDERCAVPVAELRSQLKKWSQGDRLRAWRYDHLREQWVTCTPTTLRPGAVVIVDRELGGYDPTTGWDPRHRDPVSVVPDAEPPDPLSSDDCATGADELSIARSWVSLRDHLEDVEREVWTLAAAMQPEGVSPDALEAAAIAGRLHDLGKAHPVFQESLENTIADDDQRAQADGVDRPWAKSGGSRPLRHSRRYFRHELASALALLGEGAVGLEGVSEADLVVYLVAAHHGRVRLGFRSLPGESPANGDSTARVALGVRDGDELPATVVGGGIEIPKATLRLDVMALGTHDGQPSWLQRTLALRDRADLGPFRLGFLEALTRLADWRASARARGEA